MVPTSVRALRALRRRSALAALGALSLTSACRRGRNAAAAADSSAGGRIIADIRSRYTGADAVAAGAWSWLGPDSTTWVLVDVQSAVEDLVQARAELWAANPDGIVRVGRSDVMPAAAEFGAFAFQDITRDGIPDLFGYVADSSEVSYPVFIPGGRGAMADELETAAPGWRFALGDDTPPQLFSGPSGACALQLWAETPADSTAPGWRYLSLGPNGSLGAPQAAPPACP